MSRRSQRAAVEVRERLQRNNAAIQQQLQDLKDVRQAVDMGLLHVSGGSESLQKEVAEASIKLRAAAEARRDALRAEAGSLADARCSFVVCTPNVKWLTISRCECLPA